MQQVTKQRQRRHRMVWKRTVLLLALLWRR